MRKQILLTFLLMLTLVNAQADQGQLEITVDNIEQAKGVLVIAIFDKAEHWLSSDKDKPPFYESTQKITNTDSATVMVRDLPQGRYAITIFQDLDEDHKLDTNFIGFPKEPFGFSAPMGKFGPPKFDAASIQIESGLNKIAIKLN